MVIEDLKANIEEIQGNTKAYLETSLKYYKLWGFKVTMKSTALLIKLFIVVFCLAFVLLFVSLAAAFAIGKQLDNYALGLLIVGAFYLLISIIVYFMKVKIAERTILQKFSEIFFNE